MLARLSVALAAALVVAIPAGSGATVRSGVAGRVVLVEGNCQPGTVGEPGPSCRTRPVSRVVLAYRPALPAAAFRNPSYRGSRKPIAATRSNARGGYRLDLPPGVYSILVLDRGRPYCNHFKTVACAVRITAGKHVRHDVRIDHGTF